MTGLWTAFRHNRRMPPPPPSIARRRGALPARLRALPFRQTGGIRVRLYVPVAQTGQVADPLDRPSAACHFVVRMSNAPLYLDEDLVARVLPPDEIYRCVEQTLRSM